jgi:aminoacylase
VSIHTSFVPDEEIGGADGMNRLLQSDWFHEIKIGLALDEGLASEDGEYSIFYGERLPWWVILTANGPTGHGSRFIEHTAVEQLLSVTTKALAYRAEQKNILHDGDVAGCSHTVAAKKKKTLGDVTTLNVTMLRAGINIEGVDVLNVVPDKAECGLDIRISPHEDPSNIASMLDTWCETCSLSGISGGVSSLSWAFARQPLHAHAVTSTDGRENPWWDVFTNILSKDLSVGYKAEVFPAATDSRFLRAVGLKAFGFSPIRNSEILLHEHDEYLLESVYVEGLKVYIVLLAQLASQARLACD